MGLTRGYYYMIAKHPRYVKDARIRPDAPLSEGVDCSRYKYLVWKQWGGVPGIQRTTSYRMSLGYGGWTGVDVYTYSAMVPFDLLFWTWKTSPKRINGHVGTWFKGKITHASYGRKKIVEDEFRGVFKRDLTAVRHITIGE